MTVRENICRALLALSLLAAVPAAAYGKAVTLGAPFSDNMVFQRGAAITVWGSAAPGTPVRITLGSAMISTEAGTDGAWLAVLPALAAQEGLTLQVSSRSGSRTLSNVAVGDVFLCSGQSNMEFPLGQSALGDGERRKPVDAQLRLLKVPHGSARTAQSAFSKPASWRGGQVDTASFSAICLLFGREIARERGVVVGLVNASYGGTPIESWMNRQAMVRAGGMEERIAMIDAFTSQAAVAEARYGADLDRYWTRTKSPWQGRMGFANLHNAMIAPLGAMSFAGALWYQGENNANGSDTRRAYRAKLDGLLSGWRAQFGDNLPFIIVQLAGFGPLAKEPGPSSWAEVREAQRQVAQDDPQAALVVTIDVGERLDIHPPLKKPVAMRAARAAGVLVYGEAGSESGPHAVSAKREGQTVIVELADIEERLFAASWGQPGPFQLCSGVSPERCLYSDAIFSAGGIRVAVPDGFSPRVLRYCWAAAPVCNVFDGAQLPLGPFELAIAGK